MIAARPATRRPRSDLPAHSTMITGWLLIFTSVGHLLCAAPPPWRDGNGYRSYSVQPNGAGKTGFTLMPPEQTGVALTNYLSERLVALNRVTENGSGVALGDVDGDGWCDIYFCRLEGDNVLYHNLGNWQFEDITEKAGVACPRQLSTGAVFADIDSDGDLDLLVNSIGGGTRAFLNDGTGKFTELTQGRLAKRFGATSLALADIDGDGDLDLYVANYRTIIARDEFPRPRFEARMENGQIVVNPPGRYTAIGSRNGKAEVFEVAERDFLYLNTGGGLFAPVSWTNGNFLDEAGQRLASAPLDWGLSVLMRDLNGDGRPDIITCNDFFNSPDRIWVQQPGLRFQRIPFNAIRKVSLASMAVDVADINGDGLDDLLFVEMLSRDYGFRQNHRDNLLKGSFNSRLREPFRREVPRNTLFVNNGDGTYAEIAELAGLDASEWSWGAVFMDVDLDGRPDVIIPTGHNHDVQNADLLRAIGQRAKPDSIEQRVADLAEFPRLNTPILAFRNTGALHFDEVQAEWGLNIPGVANGMACADLDNDGDLDIVVNRLNGGALLLRNDSNEPRIAVHLKGLSANTHAIGAKMKAIGARVPQQQEMVSGGRYLSCDDSVRMFACGAQPLSVEVRWPNATRSVFSNLVANCVYEFAQPTNAPPAESQKAPPAVFVDVSSRLNHRHVDPAFDDFPRQPFLPYSLSTQGPALAWYDIDGDGFEDLVIGAGRGERLTILKNGPDAFAPVTNAITTQRLLDDSMGLLVARVASNAPTLFNVIANYESASAQPSSVQIFSAPSGERRAVLPGAPETAGALALADIDGDGDLDLFVAGRVLPGRYPAPASSRIFRNDNGTFVLDPARSAPFQKIGLVSSAQFVDLNNDGAPDLILTCEWGPVRIFVNKAGQFSEASLGLEKYLGWWTSIVTGDFDNDGLTDIVVGNWGTNTKYRRFMEGHPLRLYHSDFDRNGTYDIFETIFNPHLGKYVPVAGPESMIENFPAAAERFPTYAGYGAAGIVEVIGRSPEGVPVLEINTMESICFLNRGSHFEAHSLPIEAQFAPVFGIAVADFDNDGNEDLVLGQNLFETRWETGRLDSGRPLLLRGDGKGTFHTAAALESGLVAEGQQRAVAVADFNNDARVDVAISQNNSETKLFENRTASAGIRLRFVGSAQNPDAIGSRYRVVEANRATPVREIQCGGGWLSQNSFVQVIAMPAVGARLSVTWPAGAKSDFPLPGGAKELSVSPNGIRVVK
jgi:hypothetical protein